MSDAIFPNNLPGLSWSVFRTPIFSTGVQTTVSGREVRSKRQAYPVVEWRLKFEFLRDFVPTVAEPASSDPTREELKQIYGFFCLRGGRFDDFLYEDPTDNLVYGQILGVGDGVNRFFQLVRTYGGFTEPIYDVRTDAFPPSGPAPTSPQLTALGPLGVPMTLYSPGGFPSPSEVARLYRDAVQAPTSEYTLGLHTGLVEFAAAPAEGVVVSADFGYRFRLRFRDDSSEYENFLHDMWANNEIVLRSFRP